MLIGAENLDLEPKLSSFAYQLNAVDEVKDMEYAALFHEQGLGKTKIALDLALRWLEAKEVDTVLIVTKKGLVKNWEKETDFHTNISHETLDSNRVANSKKFNKPYRLYLTHYEAVSGSVKTFSILLKTRRIGVILDEAHHMKNPNGRVAKAFFDLAPLFKRRVIMTGTPVANRPYDIWSQVYFLDQGKALGDDFKSFKTRYDLPSGVLDSPDSDYEQELQNIYASIKSFSVRETKESAGLKLPHKNLQNQHTPMEPRQYELYNEYKEEIRAQVIKEGRLYHDSVENLLKEMLRLIQVASNPTLVDESYDRRPCKVDALEELISNIEEGEKAVIWTNFIANADYLAAYLSEKGSLKLHGSMNMDARNRAVENFLNDPAKRFLVATPGAAKEGLTLTVANHAIFFDRNFSLNDWLQAQDRIHRISQEKECWVTHLFAEGSIDEWVDRLLLCKKHFAMLSQGDIIQTADIDSSQQNEIEIRSLVREALES